MNLRNYSNAEERRKALEQEKRVRLAHTGTFSFDEGVAGSRHCENLIGATQVPLGVAGPLAVSHADGQRSYFIPLATTEGALVASVSRGAKALTESGGVMTHSNRVGASRGPVFYVADLAANTRLGEFLETHVGEIKAVCEATSHHLTLRQVTSRGVGRYRYVRFVFDTEDAMGLNMVTIATDAACRFITEQTHAPCLALSANYCVDKKPSWQNFVNNRGTSVWAEAVISGSTLSHTLKTTAERVYKTWLAKCMIGSAMSGSMGFNAQYANVIAAMFIATGQDPAHVVEGSIGITTAEVVNGSDLYISAYLPDLMVGVVGGGTGLATQQEALALLGISGAGTGGNATRFAEVVGAAVLCGEVSLLSSLSQGTLAAAHQKLARGKTP